MSVGLSAKAVAFLCGEEIGMTSPEEMLQLDEATLQRVDQLLPMLKRKNFRAAVAKLKADADAASAAAGAEVRAEAEARAKEQQRRQQREAEAKAAAWREADPEWAAAVAGEKARQTLSPEQKKELSKQLNGAAKKGDTAKVLSLIRKGSDIEWQNPNDVSE